MVRAIIFDYFGVFRPDGYVRWLKDHGYERTGAFLDASERHDRGEYSDEDFLRAIANASGISSAQVEHEMKADNEFDNSLVDYVDQLRDTCKVALLSNSSSDYLRNELAAHDLERHFDEIVISSEVKLIKPEPEIFRYVVRKLDAKPENCVFIDDDPRNVFAAQQLGIRGIIFTNLPALEQALNALL